MSIRQFANSFSIIRRAEHGNRSAAVLRHFAWQGRRLLLTRPVTRKLSRSVITDDEPGSVISMVNMLGRYDYNNMHFVQTVLSLAPSPVFIGEAGQVRMTCEGASPFNHVAADGATAEQTIVVAVETLDDIFARLHLAPTLIKIDVEGHEPSVLSGATTSLQACNACLVENGDRESVVSIMHRNGMLGPFYYHHRSATLGATPQRLAEDQIFISPGVAAAYPAITVETP